MCEKEAVVAGNRSCKVELQPGTYYWCACGRSENQPWCDGSHVETEFTPVEWEVTEAQRYSMCMCKRTATPPRCDGAHRLLPGYDGTKTYQPPT